VGQVASQDLFICISLQVLCLTTRKPEVNLKDLLKKYLTEHYPDEGVANYKTYSGRIFHYNDCQCGAILPRFWVSVNPYDYTLSMVVQFTN
jgi:hypothetical protein